MKIVAEKFRHGTIKEEMEMPGSDGLRWQLNRLIVYLKRKPIGCRRQSERPPGSRGILERQGKGASSSGPAQFCAKVFDFQGAQRERAFFIYDRSIPVGFVRGENLNVENGVIVEQQLD